MEAQRWCSDTARMRASYHWTHRGLTPSLSFLRCEAACNRASTARGRDEAESSRAAARRHAMLHADVGHGARR
jgi:hypothetical protein